VYVFWDWSLEGGGLNGMLCTGEGAREKEIRRMYRGRNAEECMGWERAIQTIN
jgi:hypothetical protein